MRGAVKAIAVARQFDTTLPIDVALPVAARVHHDDRGRRRADQSVLIALLKAGLPDGHAGLVGGALGPQHGRVFRPDLADRLRLERIEQPALSRAAPTAAVPLEQLLIGERIALEQECFPVFPLRVFA